VCEEIEWRKGDVFEGDFAIKMKEANVSWVELDLIVVQQLVQTLAFDYMIEHNGTNLNGEALFVAARRCSSCCE
jgi:hypothetical protein